MVLGIITAIAACPAIIGTTEAVRQGQKANAREQHRGRKANLVISLPTKNSYSQKFDGALIVLRNNKLYIDTTSSTHQDHAFAGYYLPYPASQSTWKSAGFRGEGLVTEINSDHFLNWAYVDRDTHEVKYGVRLEAERHHCGPWDCTPVDKRMTFEAWEGFVIVQEDVERDLWALYFDKEDDGLSEDGRVGTHVPRKRMLLCQVERRERQKEKEEADEERWAEVGERARQFKEKEEDDLVGGNLDTTTGKASAPVESPPLAEQTVPKNINLDTRGDSSYQERVDAFRKNVASLQKGKPAIDTAADVQHISTKEVIRLQDQVEELTRKIEEMQSRTNGARHVDVHHREENSNTETGGLEKKNGTNGTSVNGLEVKLPNGIEEMSQLEFVRNGKVTTYEQIKTQQSWSHQSSETTIQHGEATDGHMGIFS